MSEEWTKGQEDFVCEYVRSLLVGWADESIRTGKTEFDGVSAIYVDYAQKKGWLSKREPLKLLTGGFSAAASYLRR